MDEHFPAYDTALANLLEESTPRRTPHFQGASLLVPRHGHRRAGDPPEHGNNRCNRDLPAHSDPKWRLRADANAYHYWHRPLWSYDSASAHP